MKKQDNPYVFYKQSMYRILIPFLICMFYYIKSDELNLIGLLVFSGMALGMYIGVLLIEIFLHVSGLASLLGKLSRFIESIPAKLFKGR